MKQLCWKCLCWARLWPHLDHQIKMNKSRSHKVVFWSPHTCHGLKTHRYITYIYNKFFLKKNNSHCHYIIWHLWKMMYQMDNWWRHEDSWNLNNIYISIPHHYIVKHTVDFWLSIIITSLPDRWKCFLDILMRYLMFFIFSIKYFNINSVKTFWQISKLWEYIIYPKSCT